MMTMQSISEKLDCDLTGKIYFITRAILRTGTTICLQCVNSSSFKNLQNNRTGIIYYYSSLKLSPAHGSPAFATDDSDLMPPPFA
jgi:hypothetical protein